jgi:acetoin utilization deacetylase AcuC-like enzyme
LLKIAFSPDYRYELPAGHRFPMDKYDLLPEQLLYEGTAHHDNFFEPTLLEEETALLTHEVAYWSKLTNASLSPAEIRAIGFPVNHRFMIRGRRIAQGTINCAHYALQYGCAMNIAGGTHHAFADRGEGYCCLNDQAIAANYLLHQKLASKILILDLDVHQGNGTAHIFSKNPNVFTFSMHGARNYPLRKENSDWDIPLPDFAPDSLYLKVLHEALMKCLDAVQPDFVFYQSGVDILETDKLGRLSVTRQGCRNRDLMVFQWCKKNNLPVAVSMGGGYSPRLVDIVEAHANTFRTAQEVFF